LSITANCLIGSRPLKQILPRRISRKGLGQTGSSKDSLAFRRRGSPFPLPLKARVSAAILPHLKVRFIRRRTLGRLWQEICPLPQSQGAKQVDKTERWDAYSFGPPIARILRPFTALPFIYNKFNELLNFTVTAAGTERRERAMKKAKLPEDNQGQ